MLEIDDLGFAYTPDGPRFAFTFAVDAGEVAGIVGPSGAGKSTLFDLIAGFLVPDTGDIRLDGRSLLGHKPETRPVSIVFQSDNLFEHLSAGANVALGLGSRARASDPRVDQALDRMGLAPYRDRRAASLSGGQKQRVALARTLLRNRPILLLDEPFTGLDEETARPIRALIGTLVRENGWHALLVSHQAGDISALADRVHTLENHRIKRDKTKG